jgi:hypothetical protein
MFVRTYTYKEFADEYDRFVSKHQHQNDAKCDRPWTAMCQSSHWYTEDEDEAKMLHHDSRICWAEDHRTWEQAMIAMRVHLSRFDTCDPERNVAEEDIWPRCRKVLD